MSSKATLTGFRSRREMRLADCVERMIRDFEVEAFIEIGPGETLSKFVRQIDRNVGRTSVETLEKMQKVSL